VISSHLPAALRTFLLTLAVVDDLLAITIIAVFFSSDLHVTALLLAAVPLAVFMLLVQRRIRSWWLLLPLAVTVWALVHASGVRATVAGLLAFTVPGCAPPLPACSLSPFRSCAASRQAGPTQVPVWRSISSTAGGQCRRGWRCRCSRSLPLASPSAASGVCAPRCSTRSRSASSLGWS
jgi:Na+/H+ antiporter 1